MPLPLLTTEQIGGFLFCFLRVSAIIIMIPVFGDKAVPARVKAALCLILAVILYPVVKPEIPSAVVNSLPLLVLGMMGEMLIGAIVGFTARCLFLAVRSGGEIMGTQIGFAMANVIDPLTSTSVTILSEFLYLMAMLVFLIADGHHVFLSALADSYRIVAPMAFHFSGGLMTAILSFTANVFVIAVKISAPIIAVIIFVNVGLALVARTVPQINVFIVGFPVQIAVGLIFFALSAPLFITYVGRLFQHLQVDLRTVLRLLG